MSESLSQKNTPSGQPQMLDVFNDWMFPITLSKVTQSVGSTAYSSTNGSSAGLVTQTETAIHFNGIIQPLSPKQIMLKPEGQRSWTWLQIHCQFPGVLETNDLILYSGRIYKVMARLDYSLNGFVEYHAVSDYQ